jgi:rare lipoprotein A
VYKIVFFCTCVLFFALGSVHAGSRSSDKTQRPYVIKDQKYHPIPSAAGFVQTGIASWYGPGFDGKKTSNGEVYDRYGQTAAHKILPMGTLLLVKNLENGRKTIVRINDRGPFITGRILDLSYTAAQQLDIVGKGTAEIQVMALGEGGDISRLNLNTGPFYIQIGVPQEKEKAHQLQMKFVQNGFSTTLKQYLGSNSILYAVCVYAGVELNQAHKIQEAFRQRGWKDASVVSR